jgi:hypothetical protein
LTVRVVGVEPDGDGLGEVLGDVDGDVLGLDELLGDVLGDLVGLGEVDGDVVGLGEDVLGDGDGTTPVHGVPLTRQLAGRPGPVMLTSNQVEKPGLTVSFFFLLVTVKWLFAPRESMPFFADLTELPAGRVNSTFQPVTEAVPVLLTVYCRTRLGPRCSSTS